MNKRLIELGIAVATVLILSGLFLFYWVGARETERDTSRLADMENLRGTFELVNNEYGNYAGPGGGCSSGNILSAACNVSLADPVGGASCCASALAVCKQSACEYCFDGYTKDKKDYGVYFHLEKGAANFADAGCYKLTKGGIEFIGGIK